MTSAALPLSPGCLRVARRARARAPPAQRRTFVSPPASTYLHGRTRAQGSQFARTHANKGFPVDGQPAASSCVRRGCAACAAVSRRARAGDLRLFRAWPLPTPRNAGGWPAQPRAPPAPRPRHPVPAFITTMVGTPLSATPAALVPSCPPPSLSFLTFVASCTSALPLSFFVLPRLLYPPPVERSRG